MRLDGLGQAAYRVAEQLAVRVGPRPAGSVEEKHAIDYLEHELGVSCQEVRRLAVAGLPAPLPSQALVLVGAAFLPYCVAGLIDSPERMLTFLVVSFTLPRVISRARQRVSGSSGRSSENLHATQAVDGQAQADLILCAHLDSAVANRAPGELWLRLQRLFTKAMLPVVVFLSIAAALRWVDMRRPFAPLLVWQCLRGAGLVFASAFLAFELVYTFISRGRTLSPGANDNASGVGVVLALAQYFHTAPPANLKMHYVLFTAEELGLIGSRRFVKQIALDRQRTYVINLDMVGSGERLRFVRGSGLCPPRFTDGGLNALLRAACPGMRGRYYWLGNSDFHPFLSRGFRAASLEMEGDARAEMVYHTERDVLDYVRVQALQTTAETVAKAVGLLDARLQ